MDKSASEVPFRYSNYYSGRENIGREQTEFFFPRKRNENLISCKKEKNELFEEEPHQPRRRDRAGCLTQNVKASLQDQGQSASLCTLIRLPGPNAGEESVRSVLQL